MEMQSYSTTYQRNRNENHNFVAKMYEVRQEPYLKGLWFPGYFSKLPKTSVVFLIFSIRGLPYCKPYSLPKEGSDLVGCFLTTQATACKASGRAGLSCLPEGDLGLGAAPKPLARGCHCCQCHKNIHQENGTEIEVQESGKYCPEHSESLPKILQSIDNLKQFIYLTQPANKCDQTIQSHFSITCLCKF